MIALFCATLSLISTKLDVTWVPDPLPDWTLTLDLSNDSSARVDTLKPKGLPEYLYDANPQIKVVDVTTLFPDDAGMCVSAPLKAVPKGKRTNNHGTATILDKTAAGVRLVMIDDQNRLAYYSVSPNDTAAAFQRWAAAFRKKFGVPYVARRSEGIKDTEANPGRVKYLWAWGGADDANHVNAVIDLRYEGGATAHWDHKSSYHEPIVYLTIATGEYAREFATRW